MRKSFLIFLFLFLLTFLVFGNNTELFFAQDDFILIQKFSQNNILIDFKNIFSWGDTHFRPVHNFYFFVLGNSFGKNYAGYHIFSLFVHAVATYCVYRVALKILKNTFSSFCCAILYSVNSSHFVSLFWISGNAVELGFIFFCFSFLFWHSEHFLKSIFFLFIASLASESFIFGFFILAAFELLKKKNERETGWIFKTGLLIALFSVVRFVYLTTNQIYEAYQIELSLKTFASLKYYILRVAGFSEMSGDLLISLIFLAFWGVIIKRFIESELPINKILLFFCFVIVGLFPFVLLPYHLSPHYMNLSILGSVLMVGTVFKSRSRLNVFLISLFVFASAINVSKTDDHWVIIKSRIAEAYIRQIEKDVENTPPGSTLIFNNNKISSSLDAYVALGGGKAIDFWFKDKNYQYCFSEFETCEPMH